MNEKSDSINHIHIDMHRISIVSQQMDMVMGYTGMDEGLADFIVTDIEYLKIERW